MDDAQQHKESTSSNSNPEKDLTDLPKSIVDNLHNPHKYMDIKKQLFIAALILVSIYGTSWLVDTLVQKNQQFHNFLFSFGIPTIAIFLFSMMILWGLINVSTKIDNLITNLLKSFGMSDGMILRWRHGLFGGGMWSFGLGGGEYRSKFLGWIIVILYLILLTIFLTGLIGLILNSNTVVKPNSNQPQQQVQQPNPTAISSASVDTSNWKTYANDQYKFSFQYPNTLTLEEKSNLFPPFYLIVADKLKEFPAQGNKTINPYASIWIANKDGLSLMEYINDPANDLVYINKQKLGENEFMVVRSKINSKDSRANQYYIKNGEYIFQVMNTYLYNIGIETFNKILSTFKFTDSANNEIPSEVIYPVSQFVKKESADCTSSDPCRGPAGPKSGSDISYTYKTSDSFNKVYSWYKSEWGLSGGGGNITKQDVNGSPLAGEIDFASIKKGDLGYTIGITGDEKGTDFNFLTHKD